MDGSDEKRLYLLHSATVAAFVIVAIYKSFVQGMGSPMTSSNAETDLKPIIIIIIKLLFSSG